MEDRTNKHTMKPSVEENKLRDSSIQLMDFHIVRSRVADHITYAPAKVLALEMTPSNEQEEVERLLQETYEGRALLNQVGEVNQVSTTDSDIPAITRRARLGGVLTGMEFLDIGNSLEIRGRTRSTILRASSLAPLLADIAKDIPDLFELRQQISLLIGKRGEVLDGSLPKLRALRGQIRHAYEHVRSTLTRIIRSTAGQEALQDHVISVRGDRLVVQVKSGMRHIIPGIVHDMSNTGATLFVEPSSIIDLGNTWRELLIEENQEVERVLRCLSDLVGELAEDIYLGIELGARLDFILARARYSNAIRGVYPQNTKLGQFTDGFREGITTGLRLINARHPLLGEQAVPLNLSIGPEWTVLVITGPNTGGKTVVLKTVGLLAMMNQCGIHVPVEKGSVLPIFDGIYSDIGDHQDVVRSVSTFSSHMSNVINIIAQARSTSLVLLDELGSSTDPEEGAALAKAILEHLSSKWVPTIVSTHHKTVAAHAHTSRGMMTASVDLDPSDLTPTFKLTMGIPGQSYAMTIASRLGLLEGIIKRAQILLDPRHQLFDEWLNELKVERRRLQLEMKKTERYREQSEKLRDQLQGQLDYLLSHRKDILGSLHKELTSQYKDVRRKLRRIQNVATSALPRTDMKNFKEQMTRVGLEIKTMKGRIADSTRNVEEESITLGSYVSIRGLNLKGVVLSLTDKNGNVEVNVGNVCLRVERDRLEHLDEKENLVSPDVMTDLGPELLGPELDLRGVRAGEASIRLEDFLHKAVRDGLNSICVIHGKGTGALRQVVREHLHGHPLVKSFQTAIQERGGSGVTIVDLA